MANNFPCHYGHGRLLFTALVLTGTSVFTLERDLRRMLTRPWGGFHQTLRC